MLEAAREAAKLTDRWFVYFEATYNHDVVKDSNSKTGASVAVSPSVPFPIQASVTAELSIARHQQSTTNLRCGVYLWAPGMTPVFPAAGDTLGMPELTPGPVTGPGVPAPDGTPAQPLNAGGVENG